MYESTDLTDAALVSEFGMGCLTMKRAHLWPLSRYVWESSAKQVGVTFFCDCSSPWDDVGLIRFEVFKLPSASSSYRDRLEWYTGRRKTRALKIADGMKFEPQFLHFKSLDRWEQDSFALSKAEVIRIYRHRKFAVIVRFLARSGSLLDHPVFKRAVRDLAVDESQWETEPPDSVEKRSRKVRFRECTLDEDQAGEVAACVDLAMKRLKLRRTAGPAKILAAVEKKIESTRRRRSLTEDQRVEMAIELGSLVGEVFCHGQGWEWCIVSAPKEEDSTCVCSGNRALAIEPIEWVYDLLAAGAPVNCLLTYNMILDRRLPPTRPRAYTRLN